jgi:hypothetical protein
MTNDERECLVIFYQITRKREDEGFDLSERHPNVKKAVDDIIAFGKIHHPRICNDEYLDSMIYQPSLNDISVGISNMSVDVGVSNVWNRVRGIEKDPPVLPVVKKNEEYGRVFDKHIQDITELENMASRILDASSLMFNTACHRALQPQPSLCNESAVTTNVNMGDLSVIKRRGEDSVAPNPVRRSSLASPERKRDLGENPVRFNIPPASPARKETPDMSEKSPARIDNHVEFEESPVRVDVRFEESPVRMIIGFEESLERINIVEAPSEILTPSPQRNLGREDEVSEVLSEKDRIRQASSEILTPSPQRKSGPKYEPSEVLSEEDSILQKMLAPQTPIGQGEMQLDEIMIEEDTSNENVDLTHLFTKVGSVHQNRHFNRVECVEERVGGNSGSEIELESPIAMSLSYSKIDDEGVKNDILDSTSILDTENEGVDRMANTNESPSDILEANETSAGKSLI